MASSTVWWKDGDSEHVTPAKFRKPKALELCPTCGQAFAVHGRADGTLVHPGDTVVTKDGGDIEVHQPDPFAGVS
jgi:hypothetical protein